MSTLFPFKLRLSIFRTLNHAFTVTSLVTPILIRTTFATRPSVLKMWALKLQVLILLHFLKGSAGINIDQFDKFLLNQKPRVMNDQDWVLGHGDSFDDHDQMNVYQRFRKREEGYVGQDYDFSGNWNKLFKKSRELRKRVQQVAESIALQLNEEYFPMFRRRKAQISDPNSFKFDYLLNQVFLKAMINDIQQLAMKEVNQRTLDKNSNDLEDYFDDFDE